MPFTLSLPVDASVALTEENLLGSAYFVLHVDSGLLQVLAPDLSEARIDAQGGRAGVFPEWFDDDTILVRNIDGTAYFAELGGTIRASTPLASPTPPSPTGGGVSRDGRWQASVTAVDGPGRGSWHH